MKKFAPLLLLLISLGAFVATNALAQHGDAARNEFWEKFKAAVIKKDKEAVALLCRFPIEMTYGIAKIRSKAQFLRRYDEVFSEQSDAVKCFKTAKPEVQKGHPKDFTVACKDAAGVESVIYAFRLTPSGWRFVSLDNINE